MLIFPGARENDLKGLVVTIDGPAGSGKSTTARLVAKRLGYLYLDTGAMYRAMTLKALQTGVDLESDDLLERMARDTDITIETDPDGARVILDGEDVTERIRGRDVTKHSSVVSAAEGVRRRMVELQRAIGSHGSIVAEGRDIGSVVFRDAEVKIYLDADLACRAYRRKKELDVKGIGTTLEKVEDDIRARDAYDSGREHSPLIVPDGAIIVDTTDLTIDEQVEHVLEAVRKAVGD
jgi:cytidylate kinase